MKLIILSLRFYLLFSRRDIGCKKAKIWISGTSKLVFLVFLLFLQNFLLDSQGFDSVKIVGVKLVFIDIILVYLFIHLGRGRYLSAKHLKGV